MAREPCPHCARGVLHHTNSLTSIGGADRYTIWDLHEVEDAGGVGLAECLDPETARDMWGDVWYNEGSHHLTARRTP